MSDKLRDSFTSLHVHVEVDHSTTFDTIQRQNNKMGLRHTVVCRLPWSQIVQAQSCDDYYDSVSYLHQSIRRQLLTFDPQQGGVQQEVPALVKHCNIQADSNGDATAPVSSQISYM